jgi:hypothetical protein
MVESMSQWDFYGNQGMHYMASQTTTDNTDEDLFHNAHLQLQERMRNPIAFHAEMMGDIQKQSNAPEGVQIVPSVWSLHCKRDLTTNKVKSHKARLNLHGRKQVYKMNYFDTYTPIVTWFDIRLIIIFGIIFCLAL